MAKNMWEWIGRLHRRWAVRSLLVGAVGALADMGTMVSLVEWAHAPPIVGSVVGVAIGAAINFTLNRRVVFTDTQGHVSGQLLRFLLTMAGSMAVHAGVMWILTHVLHTWYVISKLFADLLIFGVGNAVLMRYLVFPPSKKATGRHTMVQP